jgi:hypothetical protein
MKYLTILVSSILFTSGAAQAAETLNLSGVVALVSSIAVTASGSYNSLNITDGESGTTVASVAEQSNDLAGYTITMASSNGGYLQNASDSSKQTAYTISYDNASAVSPTTSAQVVKTVSSLSGLTSASSPVKINVTAYATAPAGTYSDTVTFAIVAN